MEKETFIFDFGLGIGDCGFWIANFGFGNSECGGGSLFRELEGSVGISECGMRK